MNFQPGTIVKLRNRDWIVMPSGDKNLLMIKPLDGADNELTGIYLPFEFIEEKPVISNFPLPKKSDIGNFSLSSLLFNAARLSFRNVSGPFRSFGRLSFRLRAYQIVPLVMALRQNVIRLLIADDVGIGKTIEALTIVRELIDRGELKSFAVICPPHLCEQWQQELKDKFLIDAVVVRSSTAAQLDRKLKDESIFKAYPYQVISIDFIKSDRRMPVFIADCPELVIVDEVHTCTRPEGASIKQQQRFHLIHRIASNPKQNLILLTATPHSGKSSEFQSLLGLLNPEFESLDLTGKDKEKRAEVAKHLIIRRRADVEQWHEKTIFPKRDSKELAYELSKDYKAIFSDLLKFIQNFNIENFSSDSKKKFRYFAILALLRGIMSSPLAGIEMLSKKTEQIEQEDVSIDDIVENPVADSDEFYSDTIPTNVIDKADLNSSESKFLKEISKRLERVKDNKAEVALKQILQWLKEDFNPIIFCRFIATAKYLGEYFKDRIPKNTELLIITGEMVDELRKEKILGLSNSKNKKLLITTDCLSEGINLQDHFNAVLHYDLPWNPNRLEQREGRIDRFGQTAEIVKAYLLYGKDNPIDSVVLKVLLRKAREIRRQTGISVPFPEDSQGILDALINAVLLKPKVVSEENQISLDLDYPDIEDKKIIITNAYQKAAERDKLTHSIFAQHTIKVNEIEEDLKQTDEAIGDPDAVKEFFIKTLNELGAQIKKFKKGYLLYTTNLSPILKSFFNYDDEVKISFESPTPEGFIYIGRNHPFIEYLCQLVLNDALSNNEYKLFPRASIIRTNSVTIKTTILLLRVRILISDKLRNNDIIAEEMILWGYKGNPDSKDFISHQDSKNLLISSYSTSDLSKPHKEILFEKEIENIKNLNNLLEDIVRERSDILIQAHERFRKLVSGKKYNIVEPVLPPDILGVYILLPVVM